jgi:mannitol-1-phosphate 5-dehydrogenase
VAAALEETSALLVAVHGWDAAELAEYRATILRRFANPALPDTVGRVGRQPLRKLSRHERFIGPAAAAAERGLSTAPSSRRSGRRWSSTSPTTSSRWRCSAACARRTRTFTAAVTGLEPSHPLFAAVEAVVGQRQSEL